MTVDPAIEPMLDVRELARAMQLEPIELVRELQADEVPLLPISAKRWRIAPADWTAWKAKRQARAAEQAAQTRLRLAHVAGKASKPPPAKRKVRFKR